MKLIDERSKAEKVLSLRNLSQIFLIKSMVVSGVIKATTDEEIMEEYCAKYAEVFHLLATGAIEMDAENPDKFKAQMEKLRMRFNNVDS